MIFFKLPQISEKEAKILAESDLAKDHQLYLYAQIEGIKEVYPLAKPINIDPELLKQLLNDSQSGSGTKASKVMDQMEKGEIDVKGVFTDVNFLKNLGAEGLSEMIEMAMKIKENLISPENIYYLCQLIVLRNIVRAKEQEYLENLEKIALREQIRYWQKKKDLLGRKKVVLLRVKEKQDIDKLKI